MAIISHGGPHLLAAPGTFQPQLAHQPRDPFGTVTAQTGSKTNLGYQGEYTDPDTGKVNMHARWYQPGTSTFTSRDTASLDPNPSVQANRYTYANASPMTGIDPTGHATVISGDAVGGTWNSPYTPGIDYQTAVDYYAQHGMVIGGGGTGSGMCIGSCGSIGNYSAGAIACDIWSCASAIVDPSWARYIELETEKKYWFGEDELKRLGWKVMPNGRPVPKRADGQVIDFWDASWEAQLDFMEKYDPSLSYKSLEIMWAVTAAYHNQYPTHPDGCYITCAEGRPNNDNKMATHRAAEEFARHWAKVKGPVWTDDMAANYAYLLKLKGDKDRATRYVNDFKKRWVQA
ncbi:RHS repeat-associated core domain-containing protein [Nonomuraea sp. NPDC049269]|uniref:RHS repeat-associated core domain-containing protein n=1 Tax=Nonomuraea sp. NPDC049269 TaxID=3364349 RepID=UPI00371FA4A5